MGARRRRVLPAMVAALAVVLAGCGPSGTATAPSAAPGAGQSGYPVTVQNCGRTLTFDKSPSRVVTGYEPVLETMLALGLKDRIIARLNFSENGPDGFLPGQKEQYEAIPQISDSIFFPSKEVMLAQQADFVIDVTAQSNFDPAKGQATIAELDASGAKVYITGGWCDPQGVRNFKIEDTITDVRNLGKIFGVQQRAEELAKEFEATLADVRALVAGKPPVRVLAIDSGTGPVSSYGGTGLTDQLITAAGGANVLKSINEDLTEVSVEQIAASNPDVLLVADYLVLGAKTFPPADQKAAAVFALLSGSPAAQNQKFLAVPVAGQHPGYRNILTLAAIAGFLHPDAFAG